MPLKEELKNVKLTVKKQIVTYVSAAFGFVSGLAWNDAIKGFIDYLFPQESESVWIKFIYAVLITAITAVLIYYLQRLLARDSVKNNN